jgi:hypothetical protein
MTEDDKSKVMKVWIDYTRKNYPSAKFSKD